VMAYENEAKEEIILNRGEVEVMAHDGIVLDKLSSNQKLVLHTENRKCRTLEVEASQYIGWTEGKLIFRNENMQQVAERLGRWYNVDIKIEDEELLKYAFRATFVDETLEEVLKLMALTAPIIYEEQPRNTSSNHTYQRRIIIVKLDHRRLSAFN
jgi:transmembrane sensor